MASPAVARVTVHHLTPPRRLPLIEEEGLRTRADLSGYLGEPGDLDRAAPGTYAHGKRVSAYLEEEHAVERAPDLGAGLVVFTVDPAKTLAAPESVRLAVDDLGEYWEQARPLADWLEGDDPPTDLEVHQNVPVRAKYIELRAPLLDEGDLGMYAPVVAAVADDDRLMAKALMHLCVIASEGEFDSPAFSAACALAWRDQQDPPDLVQELGQLGADKVASAALAELHGRGPDAASHLREVLEATREWGDANGLEHGRALFARTAIVLEELPGHV